MHKTRGNVEFILVEDKDEQPMTLLIATIIGFNIKDKVPELGQLCYAGCRAGRRRAAIYPGLGPSFCIS